MGVASTPALVRTPRRVAVSFLHRFGSALNGLEPRLLRMIANQLSSLMNTGLNPGRLVREARLAARLTQRELARRAHTSQSVVARVESGQTSPGSETLERLLDAAGYELRVALQPRPVVDSHMLEDAARILRLTPEQRLLEVANVNRFLRAARRV